MHGRLTLARPLAQRPTAPDSPLVLAGLFSTANGIGEAARATYRALKAAGLNPIAVDLSPQLAKVELDSGIPTTAMPDRDDGTLILQLNGPEIPEALHHLNMRRGRRWYTIGYWAWELPSFPKHWDKAFPLLSELWAISTFAREALAQHPKAPPIAVFGHAIEPPTDLTSTRAAFGLPDNAFVFLTMADSMSSMERKNPFAAIAAHKQAFGEDIRRVLVVKTRNLDRDPLAGERLRATIGAAPNIVLLDEALSDHARWQLLHTADAVVSLHRSEGFGLVLAEAMALGKPVVCTAWSGNMDFTTADNAFLVDYQLVPCEDPYKVYRAPDGRWADVDIAKAARQMRTVVDDTPLRQAKGEAAKLWIAHYANVAGLGDAMVQQLAQASHPIT